MHERQACVPLSTHAALKGIRARPRVRIRARGPAHAHHSRATCRLFTGAESERICVRKYDLVALRSFTNSSDLSGRGEREHTHSALFQLISRRNIADLCERARTRGQLRNGGNKNLINLAKRYSRVASSSRVDKR